MIGDRSETFPGYRNRLPTGAGPEELSTPQLISKIAQTGRELAQKEIELAKAELRADIKAELSMAVGLVSAGVCGFLGVIFLLVAGVMAVGGRHEAVASLIVGAVALLCGLVMGLAAWKRRVLAPLDETRGTLRETVAWAKHQLPRGRHHHHHHQAG